MNFGQLHNRERFLWEIEGITRKHKIRIETIVQLSSLKPVIRVIEKTNLFGVDCMEIDQVYEARVQLRNRIEKPRQRRKEQVRQLAEKRKNSVVWDKKL